MPVAIFTPQAGGKVGPGYAIAITGITLPVPVDDFFIVNIIHHSSGVGLLGGLRKATGSATQTQMVGTYDRVIAGDQVGPYTALGPATVSPGDSVDIQVEQRHANNSTVFFGNFTGYVWDPEQMLGAFLQWWFMHGSSSDSLSQAVLSAVQYTPTVPGQH